MRERQKYDSRGADIQTQATIGKATLAKNAADIKEAGEAALELAIIRGDEAKAETAEQA